MSGVFNLDPIFELVDDGFNQGSFMQQALVCAGQGWMFHVGSGLGHQPKGALCVQLVAERTGNIPSVGDQLAK